MDSARSFLSAQYASLCNYLEKETVGAEAVIYGASGLMLLVAYTKRRPAYLVRPFKKPSHIPDRLINERIMHTGLISDVQQVNQETLLLISHRPFIPIFASKTRVLPIKLTGVKINANGYSWLQTCMVGRKATFLPMAKSSKDDYVVSQVCLVHPPKGKRLLDMSETLLKLRFAKFQQEEAEYAKSNAKYYKHLQQIESQTKSRESWKAWAASYPWIWNAVVDVKASVLPKEKLLPELVR